jgi:transposase
VDLLDAIPPIRGKVGRPVRRPKAYFGDRAYGWKVNIDAVRERGIECQLARPQDKTHGSGLGKKRWVVEAAFSWMNNFRRLRVCYERTREHWLAFNKLAAGLICWRKAFRALATETP